MGWGKTELSESARILPTVVRPLAFRFIMVLTEHLASCESRGVDFMTPWFKWVLERLQVMLLGKTAKAVVGESSPPLYQVRSLAFSPL